RTLARSLVRPLDPEGSSRLNQPEIGALWELGGTEKERLRQRFLEEALRTEPTARQLRARAAWFVHGAGGLGPQRRERAERVLAEGMRNLDKSLPHRCEIAWVALAVSEPDSPLRGECAEIIRQGWVAELDEHLRDTWREVLLARADEFAPADA